MKRMYSTWHEVWLWSCRSCWRAEMIAAVFLRGERSWHKESCCRWGQRSWCGGLLRWPAASASTDWPRSCSPGRSAVKETDAHVERRCGNNINNNNRTANLLLHIHAQGFLKCWLTAQHNRISVERADRVTSSAAPQKKQVFPRLRFWQRDLARDSHLKLSHRDRSSETTPAPRSEHWDVQISSVSWFLRHTFFFFSYVLLFV